MLSRLDQFQILLATDASYMPSEYGRDIYHYTSPVGFMSILFGNPNNAMLWASRYDCLNDMSEGSVDKNSSFRCGYRNEGTENAKSENP